MLSCRGMEGDAHLLAEAMKIAAPDLKALGVVDRIVEEPLGGAHRDPNAAIAALRLPGMAAPRTKLWSILILLNGAFLR